MRRRDLLQLAAAVPLLGCAAANEDPLLAKASKIRPLFRLKRPPQPGDWLADHKEAGQSYAQFRHVVPKRAIDSYDTLRIVPIGPLTEGQTHVFNVVQEFMKPFFGLNLVVDAGVDLGTIPDSAKRGLFVRFEEAESPQLLTTHLLNDTLMKRRQPRDAAVLGLTAVDLWPGDGWNFVFGQASLKERVGVWSMARNGDVDSRASRDLCTLRTTMTATHETGHMFGIRHCIAYQCGMNGSNHAEERDRQPLEFCPECQPKLWWTLGLDPLARSRGIEAVARKHGFTRLADAFQKQSAALG